MRRFSRGGADWSHLPDKVAIQLNDTHPTLAVPELMRIRLDEAQLGWDVAWDLTRRTLAYTNHTLLPEALEKWPLHYFQQMLRDSLKSSTRSTSAFSTTCGTAIPAMRAASRRQPDRGGARGQSPYGKSGDRRFVQYQRRRRDPFQAAGETTVRDLAEIFRERFNNKTNGVTPRRWLFLANPGLARVIAGAIGDDWITDFDRIAEFKPAGEDAAFRNSFLQAKRDAKSLFANWLQATSGQTVDPDSIVDCQTKRIHEYKRQMLNALRVIVLYNRLRANPDLDLAPCTFFFAGKAAPAYHLAKLIIKFVNNLAGTIDGDPAIRGRIKVVFLPEYCVSLAERLIPAAGVSNQISTAGFEASGTSNMKFMMNGALTVGARDGATIEMAQEAGEENFYLFGLTAQEVADSRGWYDPPGTMRASPRHVTPSI